VAINEPEVKSMRAIGISVLLFGSLCFAQISPKQDTITVTGDAEVKVVPDRITIMFGVETRDSNLEVATSKTEVAVKRVIAAARALGVDQSDIQTDLIEVEISYDEKSHTTISYYTTDKGIEVVLKDVSKFEALLQAGLKAGANKINDVVFSTSELRKYRDQGRAMAVKAAIEKAHDLASAAGVHIAEKPLSINSSSYGGLSYGYGRGRYGYMAQNAVQNYASVGGGSDGSVALGKISVTATVEMIFKIE
jgi:uncharacterized protein YggE